jgi:hypothetical protein
LRSAAPEVLWGVEQLSGFAEVLKLFERLPLDLPDPLAGHVERPPDLVQRGHSVPSISSNNSDELIIRSYPTG